MNNVVPGLYGPVKLDIGGLVLGTIVGLGAFFILPKLFHVISGPYGGYKRSEGKKKKFLEKNRDFHLFCFMIADEPSAGGASLSEIYRRVGESLEAMNLDTTSCLQRAVCMSVQGSATSESVVNSITKYRTKIMHNLIALMFLYFSGMISSSRYLRALIGRWHSKWDIGEKAAVSHSQNARSR